MTLYQMPSDKGKSMSETQQPYMPKFIENNTDQRFEEIELSAPEAMNVWVWPISCWIIVLLNTVVATIAVFDMSKLGYSWTTHFFMSGIFAITFAAMALIYKVILRGK